LKREISGTQAALKPICPREKCRLMHIEAFFLVFFMTGVYS